VIKKLNTAVKRTFSYPCYDCVLGDNYRIIMCVLKKTQPA